MTLQVNAYYRTTGQICTSNPGFLYCVARDTEVKVLKLHKEKAGLEVPDGSCYFPLANLKDKLEFVGFKIGQTEIELK